MLLKTGRNASEISKKKKKKKKKKKTNKFYTSSSELNKLSRSQSLELFKDELVTPDGRMRVANDRTCASSDV